MAQQPGKIISWFRNVLMGRTVEVVPWVRSTTVVSPRSPPLPSLPFGPSHKLSSNYYYDRDSRRSVQPPAVIAVNPALLKAGTSSETDSPATAPQIPGTGHKWVWRET